MLQNARVAAFTVSELLRENQQERKEGGGGGKIPHPPELGLKYGEYRNYDRIF